MSGPEHIVTAADGGCWHCHVRPVTTSRLWIKDLWQRMVQIQYFGNTPNPCSRSTHCAIDGALALREEYAWRAADVGHCWLKLTLWWATASAADERIQRIAQKPCRSQIFKHPYTVACALISVGFAAPLCRMHLDEKVGSDEQGF